MPRRLSSVLLVLGILTGNPAWGQSGEGKRKRPLPAYDIREVPGVQRLAGGQSAAAFAVKAQRMAGVRAYLESAEGGRLGIRLTINRQGLPKMLLREHGSLTGPSAEAPEAIARNYLATHRALFPLSASDLDNLRLQVSDTTPDATFLVFSQTMDGIEAFGSLIKFTLGKNGAVVQAGATDVIPELHLSTRPRLGAEAAVRAALRAAAIPISGPLPATARADGGSEFRNPLGGGYDVITAKLSVFPMTASSARLAYRIFLEAGAQAYYEILVDAEDGRLLYRKNRYRASGSGNVWRQSPLLGARETKVFTDDELPPGSYVTTGNYVDAFLDAAPPYGVQDELNNASMQHGRAYSASQNLDFPWGDGTVARDPRNYAPAAVTNLFYFVNLAHHYFYGLGFTEAAGNFQTDNHGRGGLGGDAVRAAAQDGGETAGSSFVPTPDGTPPHMHMGIATMDTGILVDDRDTAYDGQIIFHEYTHGVTSRIIGGRFATSCLDGVQSWALDEGWADYFGISYFNNPLFAGYTSGNPASGGRRQSYEGYTYTYEDIGSGTDGYEEHDDGEIWAATLWDLRKTLGQTVADRLVMGGLKATPCSPSMTDARDAILSADQATSGGANRAVIWTVFARHGLGYSANGEDGTFFTGTRYDAAYDRPPDLQGSSNPVISSNPLAAVPLPGEPYTYQIVASNPRGGTLNYTLDVGPPGMTVESTSGLVRWAPKFFSPRVKITVLDGRGGKVVHGYLLPVSPVLQSGTPVRIDGPIDQFGLATFNVPSRTSALQVTLRDGLGDADLYVFAPDGWFEISMREGNSETLTFANPLAGEWLVGVIAYEAYSNVSLTASLITPATLGPNAELTGLSGAYSSETLFRIPVPAGTNLLSVRTAGGSGDLTLFLKKGSPAVCQRSTWVTTQCSYDNSSENRGNAEEITLIGSVAGDWYVNLSASESYSNVTLTTMSSTLAVVTQVLPAGRAGLPYCQTLTASGGTGTYTWTVTSGTVPAGLTLSAGGSITGTPALAGTYVFTVRVADTGSSTVTRTYTLAIGAAGALSTLTSVSAASYTAPLAASMIAAIFAPGVCMASSVTAVSGELQTTLGTTSVKVRDSAGTERPALLWFVAPAQINYLVPEGTARGPATITLLNANTPVTTGTVQIEAVAPGLFTRNADGQGVPAAIAVRVAAGGSQTWQYVFPDGCQPGSCVPVQIDLGPATDTVILQLYGTGIRGRSALTAVSATVGGVAAPVEYSDAAPGYAGLDQVNVRVPRSLLGRGEVDLVLQVDGKAANTVRLSFL